MRLLAQLFQQLDATTKTNEKVSALENYFREATDEGKLCAIALLSGKRPKRPVKTTLLRRLAADQSGIPDWLFEESYHVVGDLAETLALVLPEPANPNNKGVHEWMDYLRKLGQYDSEEEKAEGLLAAWDQLSQPEKFVFNKLITGGWRIGVSQKLMVRALSRYTAIEESTLAHRLMGNWSPWETDFTSLVLEADGNEDHSRPYPFYLAYALEDEPESLGNVDEWQAERKWDGIRGQLIVRGGELYVWSRGEELVTDKFPEYAPLAERLPNGIVLDGEIIAHDGESPLNFNVLQTRIGRKNVSKKILESAPVKLIAYDLLECNGEDIRSQPLTERRKWLEEIVAEAAHPNLLISEIVKAENWEDLLRERAKSRSFQAEGLMLKRKDSPYQVGRKRGDWWKWKVDPLTIDAVMIYAMRGHGRRANLYTDYTFAVRDGDALVSFAKAYSGLTDKEIREVDAFVKKNTIERFGPVRSVKAELVFELAFEGIAKSTRHKSGVALRFPRIKRWRRDKPAHEANTIEDLRKMLEKYG